MAIVMAALLPVFLLIVLGFVLKRSLMRLETQWHGLERLTYYVLFPALLLQTLVKADLSSAADDPCGDHDADRDCAGAMIDRALMNVNAISEIPVSVPRTSK